MIVVISPAKTFDFAPTTVLEESSRPALVTQSKKLIQNLRTLSQNDLRKLMRISDKLSAEVHGYLNSWKAKYNAKNAKQAILAFRGDVYLGLDAENFKPADFEFAQDCLRILSGLYGVLRPLDLIQPYRLEMGTKLAGEYGKDLYAFWGNRIAAELKKGLAQQEDDLLINLASNEYFKSVHALSLPCQIVTPVFQDYKNGQYKVISFFAKKARGMMARHIIRNQITNVSGIRKFRAAGYRYQRHLSADHGPVFTRKQ
jgi:cytoplasmic iron level regulating protein YaaA (DUF328/UPF0246 family)